MADPTIRETTLTPTKDGCAVEIYISDQPKDAEGARFRLAILATLPNYELPALLHLQREAMKAADDVLRSLLQKMAQEIGGTRFDLNPTLKRS